MDPPSLFKCICAQLDAQISPEFIASVKTIQGNTQMSERIVIEKMREVLHSMNLPFQEAGTQQSKDFRRVGNIELNIEVKKTNSTMVYFNDTCPCADIYYVIFFTGSKRTPPKLIYLNGEDILADSREWIDEYIAEMTQLKNKYARGENKKKLSGKMEVYPRPTFKANLSELILPPNV